MSKPADHDNMIAEVLIHACAAGHVHLSLVESGNGDSGLHGIFTPKEAFDLGCLLIKASAEADDVLRKAGVGGDVGPCTLH